MWEEQGEKVLYIKSFISAKTGDLIPRTLKERYEYLNDVTLDKKTPTTDVATNLFKAVDVKNFGATFAEEGNNISIPGAVQIGQGFDLYAATYEEDSVFEQQILSPFRDPKGRTNKDTKEKEEAKNSTLGTKILVEESHYFYPFNINPKAYLGYQELGVTEGYTEEDYHNFKETALKAVTSFATNAKMGCDNEFGLFVETKGNFYLPNLTQFVTFEKGEEKNTIKVELKELISGAEDKVEAIEVYYNPTTTEIDIDYSEYKSMNIVTFKEL